MSRAVMRLALSVVGLVVVGGLLAASPAHAASGVGIDNDGRGAVIDSRFSSTLSVTGRGFQSIKGGHGGVYVWFGTVKGSWKPSQGGRSGVDYLYVPDSESKDNSGFQRYVAFPGSDTASSASATMTASGAWSVRLVVPGSKFQAVGRDGSVETVDCRQVTCGVITIGAHGVRNSNNETFTPVAVRDLPAQDAPQSAPSGPAESDETAAPSDAGSTAPTANANPSSAPAKPAKQRRVRASLEVDRASAAPGRALSFVVHGLQESEQFSVVLDDGVVASGPHVAGPDGRATGVIALPPETSAGTHELRVFGASRTPSVRFGVSAGPVLEATPAAERTDDEVWQAAGPALGFASVAGLLFLVALVIVVRRRIWGHDAKA